MLLEQIQQTNDIKNINPKDYPKLAEEIRQFLIEKISMTGGHLGSNLGAVELTMAMHLALELPDDKIVWDVGHQSYTHKLLTGRREGFDQLRKYGGMSGFPKRKESDCDSFDTGHSSTSISAGLGLVRARDIQGKDNTVISVIGDGALTGGMAYEALNNAARMDTNFIIILNDNNMSISENVGGVSKYLNNIRTSNTYLDIKDNIYDAIRGTRYGDEVVSGVRRAKNSLKPVSYTHLDVYKRQWLRSFLYEDNRPYEGIHAIFNGWTVDRSRKPRHTQDICGYRRYRAGLFRDNP